MSSNLAQLAAMCLAEVSVTVNQHRNYYEPIAEYLSRDMFDELPADVRAEIITRDTVVEVQWYPNTPVGFYFVAHWDVDEALRLAVQQAAEEESSAADISYPQPAPQRPQRR